MRTGSTRPMRSSESARCWPRISAIALPGLAEHVARIGTYSRVWAFFASRAPEAGARGGAVPDADLEFLDRPSLDIVPGGVPWNSERVEGLPYQTLIPSLLHKYASGRLKRSIRVGRQLAPLGAYCTRVLTRSCYPTATIRDHVVSLLALASRYGCAGLDGACPFGAARQAKASRTAAFPCST